MAKKKTKAEQEKVLCSECRKFVRDTDGISRNYKGEYFMGRCEHEEHKVFANIPHDCKKFKK